MSRSRWSGLLGVLVVIALVAGCSAGPDPSAGSLFDAWSKGDSAAGKPYATPEALFALFSLPYRSSDGWEFSRCDAAGGGRACTWVNVGEDRLQLSVDASSGLVNDARILAVGNVNAGRLFHDWRVNLSGDGSRYSTGEALFKLFSQPYSAADHWQASGPCQPTGNGHATCTWITGGGATLDLVVDLASQRVDGIGGSYLPCRSGCGRLVSTVPGAIGSGVPCINECLTDRSREVTMSPGSADGAINVDPTQRFQRIDGFGFALTDSAAYLIDQVPNDAGQRTAVLRALFDPTAGIGVSWMRIVMAASDFTLTPRPWYSYRPTEADPFDVSRPRPGSPAGDTSHIIPLLQQARALSGGQMFFFANPHSAPGWMKGNGDMWNLGGDGCLLGYCPNSPRDVRDQYTQYFADFVRTYDASGVPIDALGVQNEPGNVTDYPGGNLRARTNGQKVQPAAVYTASDQLDFISRLKAKLTTSGLSQTPKLWAELNTWEAAAKIAGSADPGSVDGLSYHCYFYAKGGLDDFHTAFPDKSIDETECTQVAPAGNIPTTTQVLFDAMQHFASSGSNWNLALDPTGGPQATCSSTPDQCGTHGSVLTAPVVVSGPPGQATATLTREYYEMGQFSKFVRPGAVRIGSTQLDGIASVAFQNPDGSRVAVVHNTRTTSVDLAVNLGDGRHINPVTLQPDESSTFTWT